MGHGARARRADDDAAAGHARLPRDVPPPVDPRQDRRSPPTTSPAAGSTSASARAGTTASTRRTASRSPRSRSGWTCSPSSSRSCAACGAPGSSRSRGAHYELDGIDAQPKPLQDPMPLIVGGSGAKRSVALAARYASEYNTPFPTPRRRARAPRRVVDAWYDAGRDPGTLRFRVMTGAVLGRDQAEVDDRMRRIGDKRREPGFQAPDDTWIVGDVDRAAQRLRAARRRGRRPRDAPAPAARRPRPGRAHRARAGRRRAVAPGPTARASCR